MKTKKGGYSYSYSRKEIKEYMALSAKWKLEWLQEANRFCHNALSGKTKDIWEGFRSGRI